MHHTSRRTAQYYFDTADYVSRFEKHGLTPAQAEGVVDTLEDIIGESIRSMQGNLVTREEQEKRHYTQKVDFASLKQTLELSEKTDFVNLKAENERLLGDIERLKQRLREEITRTQAGVRLDLNLEKGRIRDELSMRVVRLADVDTRIENEIGLLRTSQAVKFNILQYAFAVMSGTGALLLAYLRMFAH
ncbi:BQ5605_C001g00270 [Microbotryum silenes-dioicae]|uniref:BQ5605_C001g00270 protein n=1 Tax=Microbotryum silenes-dioicae TaxID=796604 RepID=A0A2X0M2X5_9BASI|nr:BQ5605_C001g00270 [Microbotryum silenes-dioicae]